MPKNADRRDSNTDGDGKAKWQRIVGCGPKPISELDIVKGIRKDRAGRVPSGDSRSHLLKLSSKPGLYRAPDDGHYWVRRLRIGTVAFAIDQDMGYALHASQFADDALELGRFIGKVEVAHHLPNGRFLLPAECERLGITCGCGDAQSWRERYGGGWFRRCKHYEWEESNTRRFVLWSLFVDDQPVWRCHKAPRAPRAAGLPSDAWDIVHPWDRAKWNLD